MDLGHGLFCKYSKTGFLTLKSMGQINCGVKPRKDPMETHKIEWHFENMLGIALIFGTSLFMHFFF